MAPLTQIKLTFKSFVSNFPSPSASRVSMICCCTAKKSMLM